MRTDRDYYRILGVERAATQDQIKQQYRQLVRQHHPDANPGGSSKGSGSFLQIVEAYQILSDPDKRKEYDEVWERRNAPAPSTSGGKNKNAPTAEGPAIIQNLIAEARQYYEARNAQETVRSCKRIIQLEPENAPAYEMLGDVFAGLKRNEEAVSYYTMAQQFSKGPKDEITAKIERLMKRQEKQIHEAIHGKPVYKRAPVMAVVFSILLMAICWGYSLQPSPPIQGFMFLDHTPVRTLTLFAATAFLLGLTLAGTGQIERFDDELLFNLGAEQSGSNSPPLGLMVPVISIINFYLAMLVYLIYAGMQERFSLSVIKAGIANVLLALAFAAPHSDATLQMLLFGTGPGFAIMCFGWLVADVIRPHW